MDVLCPNPSGILPQHAVLTYRGSTGEWKLFSLGGHCEIGSRRASHVFADDMLLESGEVALIIVKPQTSSRKVCWLWRSVRVEASPGSTRL